MNISSCNTIRIYGIRDCLEKDKIMNVLKQTASEFRPGLKSFPKEAHNEMRQMFIFYAS